MNAPAAPSDPVPAGGAGSPALMNTYARSELAFSRGEGAWLIAVDGRRFLDFASGIAVTALGHSPSAPGRGADTSRPPRSGTPPTSTACRGRRSWRERLVAATFARPAVSSSAIPAPRRWNAASRWCASTTTISAHPERYRIIAFEGSFHGRTLADHRRRRQREISRRASGPRSKASTRCRSTTSNELRARSGRRPPRILVEPVQGEGGMRAGSTEYLQGPARGLRRVRPAADLRRGPVRHRAAPASCSPMNGPASRPTSWRSPRASAAASRWAPASRREAAAGMTAGSHGTTFGGNPLAMAVGNAVLDVILEPGFLDRRRAQGRCC